TEAEASFSKEFPGIEIVWFGHIGDGNLHINSIRPAQITEEEFSNKLSTILFPLVQKYHGSISAEHGIGLLKKSYLTYTRSELEITLMKGLKKVFDPDGILNPGKIFD